MNKPTNPLISIIIATLNTEKTLQLCIDSIVSQTYDEKELIVMDGGSTDKTIMIIKNNEDNIAYWESKPDRGIYHAWNKAIQVAQGDYLCFLGADDFWSSVNSLKLLAQASVENSFPDLVSGKIAIVDNDGNTLRQMGAAWDYAKMKKWMVVVHPGMLHNKRVFAQQGLFAENFKIAGDYEFLLRLGKDASHAFIDEVLVCLGGGGTSRVNINKVFNEVFSIQRKNKEIGLIYALRNFMVAYLKYLIRKSFTKFY